MARPREGTPISINLPKNALTQIRVGYPSLQPEKRRFLGPHNVRNNGSYGLLERTGRYTRKLAAERSAGQHLWSRLKPFIQKKDIQKRAHYLVMISKKPCQMRGKGCEDPRCGATEAEG